MKIVTEHVHFTVPNADTDWAAYADNHEDNDPMGWGPTEAAAVADLKRLLEERSDSP